MDLYRSIFGTSGSNIPRFFAQSTGLTCLPAWRTKTEESRAVTGNLPGLFLLTVVGCATLYFLVRRKDMLPGLVTPERGTLAVAALATFLFERPLQGLREKSDV